MVHPVRVYTLCIYNIKQKLKCISEISTQFYEISVAQKNQNCVSKVSPCRALSSPTSTPTSFYFILYNLFLISIVFF